MNPNPEAKRGPGPVAPGAGGDAPSATPARVLGLSTSGRWCSVALYQHGFGDDESDCVSEPLGSQQSMSILRMVDEICAGARIELSQLDVVAFDAGPGSFTGLRIGCSVAQGLGFALGIPLVAIDSLRALAWQRVRIGSPPPDATVLAAIDARMDELYVALYRMPKEPGDRNGTGESAASTASRLETLESPRLVGRDRFVDEIDAWLRAHRAVVHADALLRAGDAWTQAPTALAWEARFGLRCPPAPVVDDAYVRADSLAELGCADWHAGAAVRAADAAPRYLRDKVALDRDEQRALRDRRDARSTE